LPSFEEDLEKHQHYDNLSTDNKAKYCVECPKKDMPCYGTSLRDMSSEIVEGYLREGLM
jgi:hypothetical protein